jgi:F0F1-type ATP synthase alpha subunit
MSITDGQWILDMETFRSGIRPAVSMGLSVTRAGGVGHNKRQKKLASQTLKILADYRQAEEFSHFGSELAADAKRALLTGKRIFEILTQSPSDTFSLMAQQMMLDLVLNLPDGENLDLNAMKLKVTEFAARVTGDDNYDAIRDELKAQCLIQVKGALAPKPAAVPEAEAKPEDKKEDKKESKEEKKKEKEAEKEKEKELAEAKT